MMCYLQDITRIAKTEEEEVWDKECKVPTSGSLWIVLWIVVNNGLLKRSSNPLDDTT